MVKDGIVLGERYEILSKIGAGGMADVYKGRDNVLNRYVAVKVLKKEYREDETYVKKFRSEAQAAAGIMNPNIVNVYDVGVDRGLYYMVMELVEGITLKEYIAKKEKLTPKEVISITLQVCAGMEAVHKGHIIHRDIKPQNIIISNEGKVKVTDFGIAKAASSNTTSSNAMGSVHYTSPEQARGGFSDEKSDIYSIGITMYEMVTGRVPFDGDSTVAIAMKHLQEEIVPPSEYVPMPYSLEQIILKCTQKNPDLRYPNVTLLAQDLRRSLSDPNGDFVKNGAAAYGAGADTVMISESDRSKLQNQYDDEYEDEYDDRYDDDYDDEYDDDDYDTRNLKSRRNKEDNTGKKPKMSNVMKIVIALIAVLVVCAAAYGIGSVAGLFGGGSSSQEEEEVRMADVPNLANLGLTEDQAREAAEKAGFKLEVSGTEASDQDEGTVIDQDPEYGEEAERGSTINVVLSAGPSTVTVPDVTGDDVSTATEKIEAEGLSVGSTSEEYSDEYDEGEVIRTTPSSGSEVEEGSTVNLVVSQGVNPEDEMVTVQSFVGMPERNLTSWAEDNGINVDRSEDYSDDVGIGRIISQSLTSGTVAKGTTISYVVSLGGEPDEEEPSDSSNNNDNNSSDNTNNGGSDSSSGSNSSSGDNSGSSTSSDGPVWESNIQSWVQENGNPKYNVEYEENSSVSRGQVIRYEQNSDGSYTFYVSLG